ncbi:hypothetical protein LTR86_002397 [Recurvomyces mirabilis]|nr:hypothetical protein LTR86_002397 [Recurvomyces mirabilis]
MASLDEQRRRNRSSRNDQEVLTENTELYNWQQLLTVDATPRNPFAAPMLDLVPLFEQCAKEAAAHGHASQTTRYGTTILPLPISSAHPMLDTYWQEGIRPVDLHAVLDIYPPSKLREGWAVDDLLDLLVAMENRHPSIQSQGYIVAPSDVRLFLGSDRFQTRTGVIGSLERAIMNARWPAPDQEEWRLNLTSRAQARVRTLSLILNHNASHWVHV